MAQYYNVVTNANGTVHLEEVQICHTDDGQSVQLVVENIESGPNIISQPILLATAPVDNTEQTIITQPTINLGSQLNTAKLEPRPNVYIIKSTDPPIPQNIFTKIESDNIAKGSKDQLNICYTPVQSEWLSAQENNQTFEFIIQKDPSTAKNIVTNTVRNQQQIATKTPAGEILVQNTSDKKITRLVTVNKRHSSSNVSGTILRTSLQGQNSPSSKVCKMRRNSNVGSPNVSLVARSRSTSGISTNQALISPRGPSARPSIHQDGAKRNNFANKFDPTDAQMNALSERIKQVTSKQRQVISEPRQAQQKQQITAVSPTLLSPQVNQGSVPKRASMGNLINKQQQQQQQLHQLQQQQHQTHAQQQQLYQRHGTTSITQQNRRIAVGVEEQMDVDISDNAQLERLNQFDSVNKADPEENSSESIAYLQQEIDDPSTAIVQQQITGNEAKMLVILENGEQRLITFEVPKEDCTVQDLLEQASISSMQEPHVSLVSDPTLGINYIVDVTPRSSQEDDQNESESTNSEPRTPVKSSNVNTSVSSYRALSPKVPKFITGKYAVCPFCGVSAADFNYCMRCRRKLPDNVRSISVSTNATKKENSISTNSFYTKKNEVGLQKETLARRGRGASSRNRGIMRTRQTKEPECLTISSDEEDDNKKHKNSNENKNKSNMKNVTSKEEFSTIIEKEPVITNFMVRPTPTQTNATDIGKEIGAALDTAQLGTHLTCRTVRIGSYKYAPPDKILLSSNGLKLDVPLIEDDSNIVAVDIKIENIIRVLIHFNKSMPVLFFYTDTATGLRIRDILGMQDPKGPYFDPASEDQTHRRITLLPEEIDTESKLTLKTMYKSILEELNGKEANDILVKASPLSIQAQITSKKVFSSTSNSNGVIQTITVYPPPPAKGGIAINTEDFICLGEDQFLNDVIIDFYLKYLTLEVLSKSDNDRTHVFSSYFYKRLTSPHTQAAVSTEVLTPAAKRHARVQKWTKNVNIFEKDFVVIPINEHAHWFLAIVCFPGLVGTVAPKVEAKSETQKAHVKKKKVVKNESLTIGNTTITPVNTITIDNNDEGSERDEAEGDDDEMESESDEDEESDSKTEESEKKPAPIEEKKDKAVKVPCILIFDSLAGASRARVVATLRDYLSCEYQAKMGKDKIFSKDTIKGACPKVPQQSNFTDCGLYVLQYVESFFKMPILDYTLPIKTLKNWFEEIVVTRKREDIAKLLIQMVNKTKGNKTINLPILTFPTHEGKMKPKPEGQVDSKALKAEVEMKKKASEIREKSSAPISATENSESSSESSSKSGSQQACIPLASLNQASNTTDGNIIVQKESSNDPALKSPADTRAMLKTTRIARLSKMENSEDKQQSAKKHKGDSFDSCK